MAVNKDVAKPVMKGSIMAPTGVGKEAEPTFADEFIKLRRQKLAEQMVKEEFPPPELQGKEGKGEESLTTTIVRTAMENERKAREDLQNALQTREGDIKALQAVAQQARDELNRVQLDQMQKMINKMETTVEQTRAGQAQPKTNIEIIKEAKELSALLREEAGPPAVASVPMVDPKLSMELENMRHSHAFQMKQLDLQLSQMDREFQLKLAQFQAENQRSFREYEDSKDFRRQGMSGLSDLIGAITQGFSGETEGGSQAGEAPVSGPHMAATVRSFPCRVCQADIAVPPEGGKLTCPECGAEYEVKPIK